MEVMPTNPTPIIQVSLDVTTISEALDMARAAHEAGVDWLEAGTPLILAEGLCERRVLKSHSSQT